MSIPGFTPSGVLPPGDYEVTFEQLRESVLVRGTREVTLDGPWRMYLIDQAERMVRQLWEVGIEQIFLDGSFVEAKAHPNDIDGYFHVDLKYYASGQLQDGLNALYPHFPGLIALRDQNGNALQFPAAFRVRRDTNEAKGIVRIVRASKADRDPDKEDQKP